MKNHGLKFVLLRKNIKYNKVVLPFLSSLEHDDVLKNTDSPVSFVIYNYEINSFVIFKEHWYRLITPSLFTNTLLKISVEMIIIVVLFTFMMIKFNEPKF